MKRLAGFSLLIIFLSLFSCKAIKKLGQFYVDYNTQAVFPANIPVNVPLTIYSPEIATNSSQVFQNNNTAANLIQSVTLNQLTLTITSPQGQTFSFLQNVSVYISTDSLPEIEIASRQNIPANVGDTLSLNVTNADLENYIKASQITLRVSGTTDQLTTTNINVNVYAQFFVQANLLDLL
jgi:hypothetical protein